MSDSNISAMGGNNGAGIGSGRAYRGDSNISELLIVNCNIISNSGYLASGIGTGYAESGHSHGSSISILDSNVSCDGSESASIGSGHGSNGTSSVGQLNISYSSINANGATGIGSGNANANGVSSVGGVFIVHSIVHATGSSDRGAGIGSGYGYTISSQFSGGVSVVDSILIMNSTVQANGNRYSSGIGSGYGYGGKSHVINVTIGGSSVLSSGGQSGAGIGTGYASSYLGRSGSTSVMNLRIVESTVRANCGSSSASVIGRGGSSSSGTSEINQILLSNSTIILDGTPVSNGIGDGNVAELILNGDISVTCPSGISNCTNSKIIRLNNSTIQARNVRRFFGKAPNVSGWNEFAFLYSITRTDRVEPTFQLTGKAIQLRQLSLPYPGEWNLEFAASGIRNHISFNSSAVSSIAITVPNVSSYRIPISYNHVTGFLCPTPTMSSFSLISEWNVFPTGYFVSIPLTASFSESSDFPSLPFLWSPDFIQTSLFASSPSPPLTPTRYFVSISPTAPVSESSDLFASMPSPRLTPTDLPVSSTTTSNIGVMIGIVVGLISVILIVIGFLALKRFGMFHCGQSGSFRNDLPSTASDIANDTFTYLTTDRALEGSFSREDLPLELSSSRCDPPDSSTVLGLSLL
jgi:hypothetical protein